MKVHPFAEMFPMLPEEQLRELADDIAENGQIYPITVDEQGVLLDGRNRAAACKLAGVEPKLTTWKGENAESFILSVNVHRRHIPKSISAMAMAIVQPEAVHKGGRGKVNPVFKTGFNDSGMISHARTIIREFGVDSAEVKAVMAGQSLNDMYQKALELKKAKEELEQLRKEHRKQVEQALKDTPDIDIEIPANFFAAETDTSLTTLSDRWGDVGAQVARLKAQQKFVSELTMSAKGLAEKAAQDSLIGPTDEWPEGHVTVVISTGKEIIKSVLEIIEKNKRALKGQSKIRQVK
jgi:hypothetical protein